jgi:hypothetical protein
VADTEIIAADCVGGMDAQIVCSCCAICCTSQFNSGGFEEEDTCHDLTAIPNLYPRWEVRYARLSCEFGNGTIFLDLEAFP